MRDDKTLAISLRKKGKTYSKISETLGVPKSTLSEWFHGEGWAEKVRQNNISVATVGTRDRMKHMNTMRAVQLTRRYEEAKKEAEKEFLVYRGDQLFVAALMLYVGEGDKSLANNMVRITNIEPKVLRIFYAFVKKYCPAEARKVRAWILLYPDLDPQACQKYWSRELGLPHESFYKSQVIQGRHKTKKLHYGVGTITIGDKRLKVKLLRWIELVCQNIEQNAGMVQW
ncbi:MAG: hypothetical protein Q7S52_01670 [bacterium]|nr:hypothetical protein [bacterium]